MTVPSTASALNAIANGALQAARAAGAELKRLRHHPEALRIEDKALGQGTQDLVSSADRAADAVLAARLSHVLDVPYWSEESGAQPQAPVFWLVDPLDGTNNYVDAIPLYGVAVALIQEGAPCVAALHFPELGLDLAAVRGGGAWQAHADGTRSPIAVQTRPPAAWLVESSSQPDEAADLAATLKLLQQVRAVRVLGSIALALAWTAMGKLDLFLGRGHPWDVAAGMLMVEEAGGLTRTRSGAPRDPLRKEWMLAGAPATVAAALKAIAG